VAVVEAAEAVEEEEEVVEVVAPAKIQKVGAIDNGSGVHLFK
jgi:hypothetical protein